MKTTTEKEGPDCRTAVLFSGGLDSLACAHLLMKQGHDVEAIFVDYGQAALSQEQKSAFNLAQILGTDITQITVRSELGFGAGELIGRNAFFVIAAMFLGRVDQGLIVLGIHSGTPYADCTPQFLEEIKKLIEELSGGRVSVAAPMMCWSKKQVFEYVEANHLPVEVTYSCEAGTIPTCGVCASCRDRRALGC